MSDMREKLEQRLQTLKTEYEAGAKSTEGTRGKTDQCARNPAAH
jgi:hypothetical protein